MRLSAVPSVKTRTEDFFCVGVWAAQANDKVAHCKYPKQIILRGNNTFSLTGTKAADMAITVDGMKIIRRRASCGDD